MQSKVRRRTAADPWDRLRQKADARASRRAGQFTGPRVR